MSSPFPDLTPHCLRLFNTPHYQLFQVSLYDTYGITAEKVGHRTVRILARARTLLIEVIVHLDTPTAGRAALAELAPERATCEFAFATLDVLLYADIGMEPVTYFLAFSRLAPVQCAFYGHPDTSGVDTIDHYLSWASAESDDAADWYSERLALLSPAVTYAHLPKVEWAGRPADRSALGVAPGERLYTCVQTPYKLHPDFDDLLAGILESDPQARIRLVQAPVKAWGVALTQRLARRLGPLMSRVAFLPFMARADYMALLAASDVILDTPHFSGGGTTLDAIATATPVVTLAGPTLRSSQTRALFDRMGVRDGISVDGADYVRRAVDMASHSDLRADMAQRIRRSSGLLFEDVGMVREVEALFRQWVARAPR